jgi:thiopurine S-methyltransferase
MDLDFWRENWEKGQTGFHLKDVNPVLLRHWKDLGLHNSQRVLVPLCGKSVDLSFLRSLGHHVVGLELSPIAVEEFWLEIGEIPQKTVRQDLIFWASEHIEIIEGDFFKVTPEGIGKPSVVYDRAALVAMPPALQGQYASHLMNLSQGAPIFLVTFDYRAEDMDGPPFPISRTRLGDLFDDRYDITLIESRDALCENPGLAARGLKTLSESVWMLSSKETS